MKVYSKRVLKRFILLFVLSLFVNCQKNDDTITEKTFEIGQKHEGGIIFYLDESKKHGLIALEFDLTPSKYGCWGNIHPMGTDTGIGAGKTNMDSILANCNDAPAVLQCLELEINGHNDWFLPSIDELEQIYTMKEHMGNFSTDEVLSKYLSSSEAPAEIYQGEMIYWKAWTYNFLSSHDGNRKEAISKFYHLSIRPIRSF